MPSEIWHRIMRFGGRRVMWTCMRAVSSGWRDVADALGPGEVTVRVPRTAMLTGWVGRQASLAKVFGLSGVERAIIVGCLSSRELAAGLAAFASGREHGRIVMELRDSAWQLMDVAAAASPLVGFVNVAIEPMQLGVFPSLDMDGFEHLKIHIGNSYESPTEVEWLRRVMQRATATTYDLVLSPTFQIDPEVLEREPWLPLSEKPRELFIDLRGPHRESVIPVLRSLRQGRYRRLNAVFMDRNDGTPLCEEALEVLLTSSVESLTVYVSDTGKEALLRKAVVARPSEVTIHMGSGVELFGNESWRALLLSATKVCLSLGGLHHADVAGLISEQSCIEQLTVTFRVQDATEAMDIVRRAWFDSGREADKLVVRTNMV